MGPYWSGSIGFAAKTGHPVRGLVRISQGVKDAHLASHSQHAACSLLSLWRTFLIHLHPCFSGDQIFDTVTLAAAATGPDVKSYPKRALMVPSVLYGFIAPGSNIK